jgi:hypothetical protein
MNDLPSPHEDESWQKMKMLLDSNDKPLPLAFLKTYKALVILVLVLLTGIWLMMRTGNTVKEKPVAASEKTAIPQQKSLQDNTSKTAHKNSTLKRNSAADNISKQGNNKRSHSHQIPSIASNSKRVLKQKTLLSTGEEVHPRQVESVLKDNRNKQNNISFSNRTIKTKAGTGGIKNSITATQNNRTTLSQPLSPSSKNSEVNDSLSNIRTDEQNGLTVHQPDTATLKEHIEIKEPAAVQKTSRRRNKKYFISAGVAVQQQVPVAGQKAVSYGYNGIKSTFSDYIPSMDVRFERELQWFLQGEFNYAAPQLIKEFSYKRQTQADSAGTITTATSRLKKTFFDEIPLSFNYYIHNNWSAGMGGVYSLFRGAVSEKEIMTNNMLTQTVVKQIVPIAGYTDSFLYKSHVYLLLQTDFSWRRLSAGLRYTKDIQPYIKYTLPDGTITDEKNWSLKFFLRFRLIKSSKF